MEDVYVIKVKTKPPLSSVYPSERRYSASTVGGLAMVHFGLGALALLLGTLVQSFQGPLLSLACLVPFASGLLAWRRWYIDRNISIFFYGSLLSLVVAIICLVATVFDVAAATESGIGTSWGLENMFSSPDQFPAHDLQGLSENRTMEREPLVYELKTEEHDPTVNDGRYKERASNSEDVDKEHSIFYGRLLQDQVSEGDSEDPMDIAELPTTLVNFNRSRNGFTSSSHEDESHPLSHEGESSTKDEDTISLNNDENHRNKSSISSPFEEKLKNYSDGGKLGAFGRGIISFWHANPSTAPQTRLLLDINVLVACLLEIFWSLLSAKISLRGMTNHQAEQGYQNDVRPMRNAVKPGLKTKPRAPRPDILNHDGKISGNMENEHSLQGLQSIGPRLPMPESNREFRERVERFLANQAAHRVVEGSYS